MILNLLNIKWQLIYTEIYDKFGMGLKNISNTKLYIFYSKKINKVIKNIKEKK